MRGCKFGEVIFVKKNPCGEVHSSMDYLQFFPLGYLLTKLNKLKNQYLSLLQVRISKLYDKF